MVVAGSLSNGEVSRSFVTANEIHIPVGAPVRFRLIGGDVIHSPSGCRNSAARWMPFPGQTNETWLLARRFARHL